MKELISARVRLKLGSKFLRLYFGIISWLMFLNPTFAQEKAKDIFPPLPAPLQVELKEVPKPEKVLHWGGPRFSPDGEWIIFAFIPKGGWEKSFAKKSDLRHAALGMIREDGADFHCLTCELDFSASHPVWFPDGKRILFMGGKESVFGWDFYVLELESKKAFKIEGIKRPLTLEHNRFPALSPDGKKIFWTKVLRDGFRMVMGELVRTARGYQVEEVRVIYPLPIKDENDTAQWQYALAWYENKTFKDGGKTLVFASSRAQGGNLDVYFLDLVSGEIKRLTSHPEWDEGAEFSPDENWFAFETTRAHEVLSVFTQIPIPTFLDWVLVLPITNVTMTGPWWAPHEAFILDQYGDRDNYMGQRLDSGGDEHWAIRGAVHWNPAGNKLVWGELLGNREDTRIIVATLKNISPKEPVPIEDTPTPEWAPLLKEYPSLPIRIHKTLKGKFSGTAELDFLGIIILGKFKVLLKDYSEDGENFLNGTMIFQTLGPGKAHFQADLKLSGEHQGFVKADLNFSGQAVTGFAKSEKDGKKYEKNF